MNKNKKIADYIRSKIKYDKTNCDDCCKILNHDYGICNIFYAGELKMDFEKDKFIRDSKCIELFGEG